jgi:hypothetical protein
MMGRVPVQRAKDASGLLTTTVQLCFAVAVAVAVATVGSFFLGAVDGPGADVTGQAFAVCAAACGVLALDAAAAAVVQRREGHAEPAPAAAEHAVAHAEFHDRAAGTIVARA